VEDAGFISKTAVSNAVGKLAGTDSDVDDRSDSNSVSKLREAY
jgi:hypothetical protein